MARVAVKKVPDNYDANDPKHNKITKGEVEKPDYIYKVDPLSLNIPGNVALDKAGAGKTKSETQQRIVNTANQNKSGGMTDAEYQAFKKKNGL